MFLYTKITFYVHIRSSSLWVCLMSQIHMYVCSHMYIHVLMCVCVCISYHGVHAWSSLSILRSPLSSLRYVFMLTHACLQQIYELYSWNTRTHTHNTHTHALKNCFRICLFPTQLGEALINLCTPLAELPVPCAPLCLQWVDQSVCVSVSERWHAC